MPHVPVIEQACQTCCSQLLPAQTLHPVLVHSNSCVYYLQAMLHKLLRAIQIVLKDMLQCRLLPTRSGTGKLPRQTS